MSPTPMRDRFRGGSSLSTEGVSSRRQWDTGLNSHQGAPVAPYPGSVKNQKTDARFNNSNTGMGKRAALSGDKGATVPRPATAGATYPGVAGGQGPKVKGGNPGGMTQMGRTKGPDKSPTPMKNRFAGTVHGAGKLGKSKK